MNSIITVYDRTGIKIADLEASVEREWMLNTHATATFDLATTDPKCREDILRFGNRILIQSSVESGGPDLPDWGGVIDPPRTWKHLGLTVTAYSGEYLFTFRRRPKTFLDNLTAGEWFKTMIPLANLNEDLYLREGSIYEEGSAPVRAYAQMNLYDQIQDLVADSGNDFAVEPAEDDYGRLFFEASWHLKRGSDSSYTLEEGLNCRLSDAPLDEQDVIYNNIVGYKGSGTGANNGWVWSKDHIDTNSIGLYGLREEAVQASSTSGDEPSMDEAAETELTKKKRARNSFEIVVAEPAAMAYIRLGNTYPLEAYNFGFLGGGVIGTKTRVRVIGMSYDDSTGELSLNCDEVTDAN